MSESSASHSREMLLSVCRESELFIGLPHDLWESIADGLESVSLAQGEVLFSKGEDQQDLYLVASGLLEVQAPESEGGGPWAFVTPHQVVGEFQLMMGGRRSATVVSRAQSVLVRWRKETFDELCERFPLMHKRVLQVMRQRLRQNQLASILPALFGPLEPELLRDIAEAVEWVRVNRGEHLVEQGKHEDCLYVVSSGRFQMVYEDKEEPSGLRYGTELGRGETIGELSFFTGTPRAAGVIALRDSDVVRFSRDAFQGLLHRYPELLTPVSQNMFRQLRRLIENRPRTGSLRTIAVLVITGGELTRGPWRRDLDDALSRLGSVLRLQSFQVDQVLSQPGISQVPEGHPSSLSLKAWLEKQEHRHRFLLYELDSTATEWSYRCIRQADLLLLVGDASRSPEPGQQELAMIGPGRPGEHMSKQLILLHPDGKEVPSGTADWLAPRKLDMHHHIRTNRPGDFDRLARLLGDRAVGLVLSGGGARGLAHIGGYWAIREAGIPIDMIGGTSMGAIMGALCAMGFSRVQMMDHARRALIDAKPFGAYALPFISIVQSHRIEAAFADIYGDTHIEDLWLNFFAVSSNLTQHQMMIHQEGPLTEALRASSSLPGVLPPLQKDGHLLIDGGLLNNLPGDIMNKYCQKVIALDVTPSKKTKTTLPSQPTGLGWLWRRLRSKTKVNFPGILEILLGATMLSSTRHAKEVRESADFYHKLPVDDFGLLEFTALPTLVEIGYLTTEAALAKIDLIQWPTTRTFRPRSVTKPLLNK